eukprot:scaffold8729_cov77-Skeletonema_marinoi.AAC.1
MDRAINESINQRNKTIHLISSHLPSGKGSARLSKIQTHAEKEAFGSRFSNVHSYFGTLHAFPDRREVEFECQVVDARTADAKCSFITSASGFAQTATNDCLHFCMNSASVNLYLDIYWNDTGVVDRCR